MGIATTSLKCQCGYSIHGFGFLRLGHLITFVVCMNTITNFSQLDLQRQYSYADYLTWHFAERVELLRGWIRRMSPAPLSMHQRVAYNLSLNIGDYLRGRPCKLFFAPFDVRLKRPHESGADADITTVVQPDLCVICDLKKN